MQRTGCVQHRRAPPFYHGQRPLRRSIGGSHGVVELLLQWALVRLSVNEARSSPYCCNQPLQVHQASVEALALTLGTLGACLQSAENRERFPDYGVAFICKLISDDSASATDGEIRSAAAIEVAREACVKNEANRQKFAAEGIVAEMITRLKRQPIDPAQIRALCRILRERSLARHVLMASWRASHAVR